MLLKILILVAAASFAVAIFTRGRRRLLPTAWLVAGSIILLVLLAIQILRTLDTMWR